MFLHTHIASFCNPSDYQLPCTLGLFLQEQVLRDVAERVRNDKERQESRIDTMEGRAALAATKNAAMKRLRKEEVCHWTVTENGHMHCIWDKLTAEVSDVLHETMPCCITNRC